MRTEELLKNKDAFVPAWRGEWEPDARMLDFEEKWNAFHTPRGRLMSCAHRGDRNERYYPENSLEGFISAIAAGAGILDAERVKIAVKFLSENDMPPILRCGGFKPEEEEKHLSILSQLKASHRIYGERLVDADDNETNWQRMVDIGYNIIMGNNIYAMTEFVKEKLV